MLICTVGKLVVWNQESFILQIEIINIIIVNWYEHKYYVISKILFKAIEMFVKNVLDSRNVLPSFSSYSFAALVNNEGVDFNYSHDPRMQRTDIFQDGDEESLKKAYDKNRNLLKRELEQAHILIAEDESELLVLFREYLSSLGINTDTADRGDMALDRFLERKDKEKPYDAIILDTHLCNPSGPDVAKRIRLEKPDQKIVLITTTPKENLPKDCLEAAGIKDNNILTIPFQLSKLASVLKTN